MGCELEFEKKTISWEMGLGPPLHDPLCCLSTFPQNGEGEKVPKYKRRGCLFQRGHLFKGSALIQGFNSTVKTRILGPNIFEIRLNMLLYFSAVFYLILQAEACIN